jgi:hypothetical protein
MAEPVSIAIPDLEDESVDEIVIKLLPKFGGCRLRLM